MRDFEAFWETQSDYIEGSKPLAEQLYNAAADWWGRVEPPVPGDWEAADSMAVASPDFPVADEYENTGFMVMNVLRDSEPDGARADLLVVLEAAMSAGSLAGWEERIGAEEDSPEEDLPAE